MPRTKTHLPYPLLVPCTLLQLDVVKPGVIVEGVGPNLVLVLESLLAHYGVFNACAVAKLPLKRHQLLVHLRGLVLGQVVDGIPATLRSTYWLLCVCIAETTAPTPATENQGSSPSRHVVRLQPLVLQVECRIRECQPSQQVSLVSRSAWSAGQPGQQVEA
jgi:hypothetical protein